jgi:AmiR/NasT family two-component response regulator
VTRVLLLTTGDAGAPDLTSDFVAAGFEVDGPAECAHLVREALRRGSEVVVCWAPRPDAALLDAIATLQAQQPTPVVVFTKDASAEPMQRALQVGVHAWVVQGYARERLRPLVQLACAREAQQRELRGQVADLGDKLEERKLIDKAKGILMHSRSVTEEEAFKLLRRASMHANQRVGQVSRQVIDAARVAQAINRAGQQRMLSQRLVKLYALSCSGTDAAAAAVLMRESIGRIDDNLGLLESDLSAATFGDLVAAAKDGWQKLRQLLDAAPHSSQLQALDAAAEVVVAQANALIDALEDSGQASSVGVVNQAGRLRLLSQRMAKLALLGACVPGASQAMAACADAFEAGLRELAQSPLSTPEIRILLGQGEREWKVMREAVPKVGQAAGRMKVAAASEELFSVFDRLTEAYQHSMQVLMG